MSERGTGVGSENVSVADGGAKPAVAVFTYRYLARTMTFVYQQLLGVCDRFEPIALATLYEAPEFFPYEHVYVCETNPVRRVLANGLERVTGRVDIPSRPQTERFAEIARRHDVKLIYAHFGTAGMMALPLARLLDVPLLVLFHGYDASRSLRFSAYRKQLQPLFEYADVLAVSRYFADRLIEHGADPDRTGVFHCGVPVDRFVYRERKSIREKVSAGETIRYLQVASFADKKGHRYTLEAFRDLFAFHPNSELIFVGDGGLRRGCEKLASELGIAGKVRFEGWAAPEQVESFMAEADVFVHHSVTVDNGDQEGIPTGIMEAMATGLPVVTSLHSGIPELVQEGESGALVPERAVPAYAAKLRETLEWGSELGRNARRRVEDEFNIERQSARLGDIYARLIER